MVARAARAEAASADDDIDAKSRERRRDARRDRVVPSSHLTIQSSRVVATTDRRFDRVVAIPGTDAARREPTARSLTPVRATRTPSIARSPRRVDAESLTRASAGLNRARARDPIARFASSRSTAQTWTSGRTSSARARRARPRRRRRSRRRRSRRPRSRRSRLRARASSVASNDGDARVSEIPTSATHLSPRPSRAPRPVSSP